MGGLALRLGLNHVLLSGSGKRERRVRQRGRHLPPVCGGLQAQERDRLGRTFPAPAGRGRVYLMGSRGPKRAALLGWRMRAADTSAEACGGPGPRGSWRWLWGGGGKGENASPTPQPVGSLRLQLYYPRTVSFILFTQKLVKHQHIPRSTPGR